MRLLVSVSDSAWPPRSVIPVDAAPRQLDQAGALHVQQRPGHSIRVRFRPAARKPQLQLRFGQPELLREHVADHLRLSMDDRR